MEGTHLQPWMMLSILGNTAIYSQRVFKSYRISYQCIET